MNEEDKEEEEETKKYEEPTYLRGKLALTKEEEYLKLGFKVNFDEIMDIVIQNPQLLPLLLDTSDLDESTVDRLKGAIWESFKDLQSVAEEIEEEDMKKAKEAEKEIREKYKETKCVECNKSGEKILNVKEKDNEVVVMCAHCGYELATEDLEDWL